MERDLFFFSDFVRLTADEGLLVAEVDLFTLDMSDVEADMGGVGRGQFAAVWVTSGEDKADFLREPFPLTAGVLVVGLRAGWYLYSGYISAC